MKTAMQELIEHLDIEMKQKGIIPNWDMLLEKEKEQIIQAHKMGWEDCQEYIRTIGQTIRKGKKYYNQTYNQKQHIIDIMKADEDDGLYDQNKLRYGY
jgi:hypothetical protein